MLDNLFRNDTDEDIFKKAIGLVIFTGISYIVSESVVTVIELMQNNKLKKLQIKLAGIDIEDARGE
ncbi:MAG: hypothetical protein RR420_01015 [Anaerovoracaceae bacterium]